MSSATSLVGFTPGIVSGFTPGVVSGFTPGVVSGFTPGVVSGFTPGVVPGFTPGVVPVVTPNVPISSTHANPTSPQVAPSPSTPPPTTATFSSVSVLSTSPNSASSSSSPSTSTVSNPTPTTKSFTALSAASNTKTFPSPTSSISTVSDTNTFPSSASISAASDTNTPFSSVSVSPSSSASTAAQSTFHNKNITTGVVVGGIVGLLILTAAALFVYYLIRRSYRNKKHTLPPAVGVSPESVGVTSQLRVSPYPYTPTPNVSATDPFSDSDSNLARSISIDDQQQIGETIDQRSRNIVMSQRDSLMDRSISHPSLYTLPSIFHNLLRDVLNAAQGYSQGSGSSGTGDSNLSQIVQIPVSHQPSDTNGSVSNDGGENKRIYYRRFLPRDMDVDTLSLPPSYEQVSSI